MRSESSVTIDRPVQPGAEGTTAVNTPVSGVDPRSWDTSERLSLDLTFELLQNHRRRCVLRYLDDHPSTTLSTLAEHIAAQENRKLVQQLTSQERKRVYISLYQCHLPKLDDAGAIAFDSDRGTVERKPPADHFGPFLNRVESTDGARRPAWPNYYLAIALVGGGLLAAQLALLPTLAATSAIAVAVIAVLCGLALVHGRHESRSSV